MAFPAKKEERHHNGLPLRAVLTKGKHILSSV